MSTRPIPAAATPRPSFLSALSVQARVIGALIMRELHTRYGRENIGYLWMIGEPLILATVIGIVHGAHGVGLTQDARVQAIPFGVLGYVTFIMFRSIVNRAEGGLEANGSLLYHRQVTVLDITIARALLEFASAFSTLCLLMALLIGLGMADFPARPLAVFGAWALLFVYSFGHSTLIGALSYDNRTFGRFVHPYSYFMVFLSGAFTPLKWLPHNVAYWLSFIPITSIFELVRYGWFSTFTLDLFYPLYLVGACLVLNWVGLVCLASVRSKIHLS